MPDLTTVQFLVWHTPDDGWGARAKVDPHHPYAWLSAFADTPHEALRDLVQNVIPAADEIHAEA